MIIGSRVIITSEDSFFEETREADGKTAIIVGFKDGFYVAGVEGEKFGGEFLKVLLTDEWCELLAAPY